MKDMKFENGEVKVKLFKKENLEMFNLKYFLVKNGNKNYVVIDKKRSYYQYGLAVNRFNSPIGYEVYELPEGFDLSLLGSINIRTMRPVDHFDYRSVDLVIRQWSKMANELVSYYRPQRYRGKFIDSIPPIIDDTEYVMYILNCYDGDIKVFGNLDEYNKELQEDTFKRSPEGEKIAYLNEIKEDIIIRKERIDGLKDEIRKLLELVASKELEIQEEQEMLLEDKQELDSLQGEVQVLAKR